MGQHRKVSTAVFFLLFFLLGCLSGLSIHICICSIIHLETYSNQVQKPSSTEQKLLLAHPGPQRLTDSTAPWGSLAIDFTRAQNFCQPFPAVSRKPWAVAAHCQEWVLPGSFKIRYTLWLSFLQQLLLSLSPRNNFSCWPHQPLQAQGFPALTLGSCTWRGPSLLCQHPFPPG